MGISIKNAKAEALARQVARESGETLTEAIIHALEERLMRIKGWRTEKRLSEEILEIARRCSSLPELDPRSADEILGYTENGGLK
jgi:antitoxin VapB